jgi:opacity protein-like surface antigen
VKSIINLNDDRYNITMDVGIGPNIIQANNLTERSLDDGITQPDHIFSSQTSVAFSATAGVGIRFNNVSGHIPIEIGYRFFYLGQGNLNKVSSQATNTLKTGNSYANALVITISNVCY